MNRTKEWLRRIWGAKVSAKLLALEQRLGHTFRDRDLLRLALTHRSFANEQQLGEQNERLEFLGDAVLDLVAATLLYGQRTDLPEGELSRRKSYLVSEPTLAALSAELQIGRVMRLGVGEDRSGGRKKPSLLADALEAVFGAVYLDGGLAAAAAVIEPLLEREMERAEDWDRRDAKTRLQERVQAAGLPVPRYTLLEEEGPDHDKLFTVECRIAGRSSGTGIGTSKKAAEQEAASDALERGAFLDPPGGHS